MSSALPIGTHGSYPKLVFPVPADVAALASHALAIREAMPEAYIERTKVGAARAKQLASGGKITLRDAHFMFRYFARHYPDVAKVAFDPMRPTAGWNSWNLWGGTPAARWVAGIWLTYGGLYDETDVARSVRALLDRLPR